MNIIFIPYFTFYLLSTAVNEQISRNTNLPKPVSHGFLLQLILRSSNPFFLISSNEINSYLVVIKHYNKMDKNAFAQKVVARMMETDLFSKWLGIELIEINEGYSKIKMTIRNEMINAFGIVHGGVTFSLADSAFAFACNNRNNLSVALDTSINFIKPVHVGDILIAEAKEIHNGKSTGLYQISITNQHNHVVALFKGTCFRTNKKLVD